MRKKFYTIFLCGIILFSVCGCGNQKENTIKGKYSQTDIQGGSLTLYENGTCNWVQKFDLYGKTETTAYKNDECSYDYIDNEITITYIMYKDSEIFDEETNSITCNYNNGTINCGTDGTYSK